MVVEILLTVLVLTCLPDGDCGFYTCFDHSICYGDRELVEFITMLVLTICRLVSVDSKLVLTIQCFMVIENLICVVDASFNVVSIILDIPSIVGTVVSSSWLYLDMTIGERMLGLLS